MPEPCCMNIKTFTLTVFLLAALFVAGARFYSGSLSEILIRYAWSETQQTQAGIRPWPWVGSYPVAEIDFPDSGHNMVIMSGSSPAVLAVAPLWNEGTHRPGMPGISLISGDYHTRFGFLKNIKPGDSFNLRTMAGDEKRYVIEDLQIVEDAPMQIKGGDQDSIVILSTAYPFKSGSPDNVYEKAMHLVAVAREVRSGPVRFADLK